MADALTTGGTTTATATTDAEAGALSPVGEVLRDIARGGLAGILVGIFVAGIGGRLVMRLATILHEDTVGRLTEQQAIIGAITFEGTLALLLFGGLGMGLLAGMIWVIVREWLPGHGLGRAVVTGLLAVAIGSPSLIQRTNPDFSILGFDPLVVAMLLALVFAVGFSMALTDGWLDRHLPRARRGIGVATTVYLVITLLGLILIVPIAVAILLDQSDYRAPIRTGFALLVAGCLHAHLVGHAGPRPDRPAALADADRSGDARRGGGPGCRDDPAPHPGGHRDALVMRRLSRRTRP